MERPLDWQRHMKARHLADGLVAYYRVAHERDVAAGFTLKGEPLGKSYGDAIEGAHMPNTHLDAWREGRGTEGTSIRGPGGTYGLALRALPVFAGFRAGEQAQPAGICCRPSFLRATIVPIKPNKMFELGIGIIRNGRFDYCR